MDFKLQLVDNYLSDRQPMQFYGKRGNVAWERGGGRDSP